MGFSPWGCKGSDTTEMTYHNRFKIYDKEDDAGIVNNTFHCSFQLAKLSQFIFSSHYNVGDELGQYYFCYFIRKPKLR